MPVLHRCLLTPSLNNSSPVLWGETSQKRWRKNRRKQECWDSRSTRTVQPKEGRKKKGPEFPLFPGLYQQQSRPRAFQSILTTRCLLEGFLRGEITEKRSLLIQPPPGLQPLCAAAETSPQRSRSASRPRTRKPVS